MNIFASDPNPVTCAVRLDDKRILKMILETSQLLNYAIKYYKEENIKIPYSHHPCSKWVRNNIENFKWALDHFYSLLSEYTYRFRKIHQYSKHIQFFNDNINHIKDGKLNEHPNCTIFKDYNKDKYNIYDIYEIHLIKKWRNSKPKWTKRNPPKFYIY